MKKMILFLVAAGWLSCTFTNALIAQSVDGSKEYKTKTGKTIIVKETHPEGQSLSDLSVSFTGNPGSALQYKDVDPINKVLVGDLDGNGFDEIYIITIGAGSGSYGNIIGIASNSDKSLLKIFIPEVGEKDLEKGGNFEGYEGHDVIEIIDNSMVRTFPVKAANAKKHVVIYKLKAGEAGYLFYIQSSTAN